MKCYVVRWKIREDDDHLTIDYWFSTSPKEGATWPTRESVDVHVSDFNRKGVTIPSSDGGEHSIHNFTIEERNDGKFVAYCDAPFIAPDRPAEFGDGNV